MIFKFISLSGVGLTMIFISSEITFGAAALNAKYSGNRPLAIVNLDTIRTTDMNKMIIAYHNTITNEQKSNFDYEKLLKKSVNDRLLVQEAKAMQMDKDENLQRQLDLIRENLALSHYMKQNYKPSIPVTSQEIAKSFEYYYRKLQIRTMAVPTEADANMRIADIHKGASMDSLAKAYSFDTWKYDGGLHPLLHFTDIEIPLREIAVKLKVGEISKPFPYRDVYCFLKLEKHLPADPKELPHYQENIKAMLLDARKQLEWEKFLSGIKSSHHLKANNVNLQRIEKDSARVLSANYLKGDSCTIIMIDGGKIITDSIFRTRVSRYVMSDGNLGYQKIVEKAFNSLASELALSTLVKEKGYLHLPAVNAAVKQAKDSCLLELYLQEVVVKTIKFNKPEFDEYYNQHLDDFRDPDQFKFSQILTSTKDSAEALQSRLNKGADFKFLSTQLTSGKSAKNRNLEWVTLTVLPDKIQSQLQSLSVGSHSEPFHTTEGWVILNVEDRRKGKLKTKEEVDMKMREIIFQRKFKQNLDTVLNTLKKNSTITYFQENIREYFGKTN